MKKILAVFMAIAMMLGCGAALAEDEPARCPKRLLLMKATGPATVPKLR